MKIKILLIWVVALSSFSLLLASNSDYVEKRLQVYGTDSVYLVTVKLPADSTQTPQYRMGILDTKGNVILPPVYHSIDRRGYKSFFEVMSDLKFGIYSFKGEELLPVEYDSRTYLVDNCFTIRKGDKMGVFDEADQRIIIPVIYGDIRYKESSVKLLNTDNTPSPSKPQNRRILVSEGAMYSKTRGKIALLDLYTGKPVLSFGQWDYIEYSDRFGFMYLIQKNGDWQIADYSGKVHLTGNKGTSAYITPFGFIISEDNLKGFVPLKGKRVEPLYDNIVFYTNGYAIVSRQDEEIHKTLEGVMNAAGKLLVPPEYEYINITTKLIYVTKDRKAGVFGLNGKVIFPANKYEYIEYFPDVKVAVAYKESKEYNDYGLVDSHDKQILPFKFRNIYYADGIARTITHRIGNGHLHGMYNVKTKKLIEPRYDGMGKFVNGVSEIGYYSAEGNKHGLLDENGIELVEPIYETMFFDDAQQFATVTLDGKHGMIGARGEIIVPVIFDRFTEYRPQNDKDGLVVCEKDSKFAAYNFRTGKEILPYGYDSILRTREGLLYTKDGKTGYCDRDGNINNSKLLNK